MNANWYLQLRIYHVSRCLLMHHALRIAFVLGQIRVKLLCLYAYTVINPRNLEPIYPKLFDRDGVNFY